MGKKSRMLTKFLADGLAVLALVVLAVGSIFVALALLNIGGGPSATDPYMPGHDDYGVGAGLVLALVWPIVLIAVGLLGASALYLTQGKSSLMPFIVGLVGVYALVLIGTIVCALLQLFVTRDLSSPGVVFALPLILLFLAINSYAVYIVRRYVFHSGMRGL